MASHTQIRRTHTQCQCHPSNDNKPRTKTIFSALRSYTVSCATPVLFDDEQPILHLKVSNVQQHDASFDFVRKLSLAAYFFQNGCLCQLGRLRGGNIDSLTHNVISLLSSVKVAMSRRTWSPTQTASAILPNHSNATTKNSSKAPRSSSRQVSLIEANMERKPLSTSQRNPMPSCHARRPDCQMISRTTKR